MNIHFSKNTEGNDLLLENFKNDTYEYFKLNVISMSHSWIKYCKFIEQGWKFLVFGQSSFFHIFLVHKSEHLTLLLSKELIIKVKKVLIIKTSLIL